MTDHDPLLDGITCYTFDDVVAGTWKYRLTEFVDVADLPALIAKVREDEAELHGYRLHDPAYQNGYAKGRADALAEARDAVAALPDWKFCDAVCGTDRSVLAAIDALRGDA